jgi:hypothetical protein
MKTLNCLVLGAAFLAGAANAEPASDFQAALSAPARPAHPALYSFADVYRLTVAGAAMANAPLADSLIRVAATPPASTSEAQFSISVLPQPERWLLLVSGLALAAWVARRRLGYSY